MKDSRLVLKSSTQVSLNHSCIEYCVEKREYFSNIEYIVVVLSLLMALYSYIISTTIICIKIGFIVFILFMLSLWLSFKVHNESLLITAPIGLQLTTTYITGHQRVFSLPWQSITDVLIVDVIRTQKVLYYLAIKTPQNGLVTLFQKSAPRLNFLEIIYKDIYKLLESNR
ncbi:GPI-GlcNAc transferase complex, PIG-H component, conserved domain [Cinara cedri]|uniref:GPI-GlcNAc transferase complex, PIG-H component, conserved domain n=1 Tax=Cinara cedri TaxID=506608 RepID=A0A5E4N6P8_9HEMI|nr:GPI-GlcNAc transferase complex, PIG-H component, conserved domain [Cinara cedri]